MPFCLSLLSSDFPLFTLNLIYIFSFNFNPSFLLLYFIFHFYLTFLSYSHFFPFVCFIFLNLIISTFSSVSSYDVVTYLTEAVILSFFYALCFTAPIGKLVNITARKPTGFIYALTIFVMRWCVFEICDLLSATYFPLHSARCSLHRLLKYLIFCNYIPSLPLSG
jgi:hypothetical protein